MQSQSGFTLVELLIGMAVLAIIAVTLTGVSLALLTRISDDSLERRGDATTAQWASITFARDVQSAIGTAPECHPGEGTRLVTLRQSGSEMVDIEYRVTESSTGYTLVRTDCSTVTSRKIVRNLAEAPSVSCDDTTCTDGTAPRRVVLHVSRRAAFGFELDGVRRTTDGNLDPDLPPAPLPAFVSLTGDRMDFSGSVSIQIRGDAYLNRPNGGSEVMKLTGSVDLDVSGEFRIEDGATITTTGSAKVNAVPGPLTGPFPDPLRHLPAPDPSGLPIRNTCTKVSGKDHVCEPGIYTVSFPPSGTGQNQFVLQPGTYILRNGINSTGGVGITSNGGVLLYVESGSTKISGSGDLVLSALQDGPYTGILFFQSRSNTASFSITGSSTVSALDGLIYAPTASSMKLTSGSAGLSVRGLIGVNMGMSGSGHLVVGDD